VVILGGGSAGLTAACELVKNGVSVDLVEIKPVVGGLSLSFEQGDFRLDYGPHAFHVKDDDVDEIFKAFCHDGCYDTYMKACLLLHGQYFDYPLRFGQALLRLHPLVTARLLFDYCKAQARRLFTAVPEDSFEAWGVKRYGRTMYELAFGQYSRKVWGMPTTQLSKKMAEQKLPDLNLLELVVEALGGKGAKQKMLYSSYWYPKGGIGMVFENMARFITAGGSRIHKSSRASEIRLEDGQVKAVRISHTEGNPVLEVECSHLISTIPISDTIQAIVPSPPARTLSHAARLLYRNLILVFVVIDMPNVTHQIMVYLLDEDFTFNRIGEQKNIDPTMIPKDKTVLCFEICANEQGEIWQAPDERLFQMVKEDLTRLGTVPQEKIEGYFVRRLKHAYPISDLEFDRHLEVALGYLLSIPNLIPLGRQGLFIHNDIHDSMKMGLEGARHVLAGKPKTEWDKKAREYLDWRLR
jgi:protoporphyrinogen oxidase